MCEEAAETLLGAGTMFLHPVLIWQFCTYFILAIFRQMFYV